MMHWSEFWFPFLLGGLTAYCSVGLAGVIAFPYLVDPRRGRRGQKATHQEEA